MTKHYYFKNFSGVLSIVLLLVCILISDFASAQIRNRNNNRPSETTRTFDSTTAIEERLVQLALDGPLFKETVHRNRINELQLIDAKRDWVNLLTLSANYNDQSFAKNNNIGVIYPRYFFGVTIPLGTILSRTDVKAARESIEISKANQEQLRRTIRAEVLSKYRQYLAFNELITLQGELVNDVQAALLQTEQKFRDGLVSLELYTGAQRAKNDESARLINLQLQQELVELDLERMIGTSLESVIN